MAAWAAKPVPAAAIGWTAFVRRGRPVLRAGAAVDDHPAEQTSPRRCTDRSSRSATALGRLDDLLYRLDPGDEDDRYTRPPLPLIFPLQDAKRHRQPLGSPRIEAGEGGSDRARRDTEGGPSEPGPDPSVRKLPFTVAQGGEDVPALLWLPERPQRRRPVVLLGHGGGMHKESPLIDRLGTWLAGGHDIACLAIDLPFHGERTPADEFGMSALERRRRLGLDGWRERNAGATGQAVADWRAAMDGAQDRDRMPHGPIGYFGVSMGTRFGVPLIAAEPRIAVAVLGLFGVPAADHRIRPSPAPPARSPSRCCCSCVRRSDDELFPRDDGLTLFDLLGSPDKTLHAHPGGHLGIPRTEFGQAVQFLRRHLGSGNSDPARREPGGS